MKILHEGEDPSNRKIFFNRLDPDTKLTALHYAARFNHYQICQYLIEECEADANKAGDDGMRPLHYVARFRVENDVQVRRLHYFDYSYSYFFRLQRMTQSLDI